MNKKCSVNDSCLFCKNSIEQVGGSKIISSHLIKCFLSDKSLNGGDQKHPYQSVSLDDDRYLVFKGNKLIWTKNNIDKALSLVKQGLEVWWCQKCANRTCKSCGSPTQRAYGCDLVGGTHVAALPVSVGCTNIDCEHHLQ